MNSNYKQDSYNPSQPELQLEAGRVVLNSPTACPLADGFLWNQKMMAQVNCRGYIKTQYLSPEPQQYSQGPVNEATTFMMPEGSYYQHHPGRFFYLLDEESGELFSAPYEPVRATPWSFQFIAEDNAVSWHIVWQGIELQIRLQLVDNQVAELWRVNLKNLSARQRRITLVPYFSLGYQSWMNQQAFVDAEKQSITVSSVHPWQLMKDYPVSTQMSKRVEFKSFHSVDDYCVSLSDFEGEGGLAQPDAILKQWPASKTLNYQTPVAAFKHQLSLKPNNDKQLNYVFGLAENVNAFSGNTALSDIQVFNRSSKWKEQQLSIDSPCEEFNQFVNHWLPRQLQFLCEQNRFCTDPQTRNFLQDQMGIIYFDKDKARQALLFALAQQNRSGAMPDGILLNDKASLKYINQVPHADHCVWLFYFLQAWLNEHSDLSILSDEVGFVDDDNPQTVLQHFELAAEWLVGILDKRGLSRMEQGDWCDPMNMVGHKGQGVSIWLSMATCWALQIWCDLLDLLGEVKRKQNWSKQIEKLVAAINDFGWDGDWYSRAINDAGRVIGSSKEKEGKIFLNSQSFAILSGVASNKQLEKIQQSVRENLFPQCFIKDVKSPIKVPMMLAPAYSQMDEGIGRVTQKSPGTAENASVYNHAAIFYAFALYRCGDHDNAWAALRDMIPDATNFKQLNQLPLYIPNYYRGFVRGFEKDFARSSRLFNTGTIAWYYRCVVEELCGLKGCAEGLKIEPKFPASWTHLRVTRKFRGAIFDVNYSRSKNGTPGIQINGKPIPDKLINDITPGQTYRVEVELN